VISNATSIGTNAFKSCVALVNLIIPSVTSIGATAFAVCPALKLVVLPNSSTTVTSAFLTATKVYYLTNTVGSIVWSTFVAGTTFAQQQNALTNYSTAFSSAPLPGTAATIVVAAAAAVVTAASTITVSSAPLSTGATDIAIAAVLYAAASNPAVYSLLPPMTVAKTLSTADSTALVTALQALPGRTNGIIALPISVASPSGLTLPAPPAIGSYFAAIDATVNATYRYVGSRDTLVVSAGSQIFNSHALNTSTVLSLGTNYIFTYNSGDAVNMTVNYVGSNSSSNGGTGCFLKDAPVLTSNGYKAIGTLAVGDYVQAPGGALVAIKSIKTFMANPKGVMQPYIIPKGRYGALERVLISPYHLVRVAVNTYKEARYLGLERESMSAPWTYYNLELADSDRDMIISGVIVETWKAWDGVERKAVIGKRTVLSGPFKKAQLYRN